MRLLTYDEGDSLHLTRDLAEDDVEPYAILSHTWGDDEEEVKFDEVESASGWVKAGYRKIKFCGEQARQDEWRYFWVDTCCINKANHTELSKAITSMYRWYKNAQVCYVYLADVSFISSEHEAITDRKWESAFRKSQWFSRGWTLQELLAPRCVIFFSKEGTRLGTKNELKELIRDITGIPVSALDGQPLSQFPVIERMRWTHGRQTKEKEDQAYCLLGIFDVHMYLNYGEGAHAFRRLQLEIDSQNDDVNTIRSHNHRFHEQDGVKPLGLCLTSAPLIPSKDFIGRAAEIDAIHEILRPHERRSKQERVVVGGIGGMGKTQLVIAYAQRYSHVYASVLWLNATSESTLFSSLQSIARVIGVANEVENFNNDQVLGYVHRWLSNIGNRRWLMIIDNHDDPDVLDIDRYCPNIGHGFIIITTRLPDQVTGPQIRLQPLDQVEDSLCILKTRSGRENVCNDKGAFRLAKRLAGYPLALATAGAYLRKSTISFERYLEVYDIRWQVAPSRVSQLQDYRNRTLYTTWNLTYERLKREHPEAAQILKLLAYFDNQEVWYELLKAGLSDRTPPDLQMVLATDIDFENVMSTLVEYCLVDVQHAAKSYSMHNCVHDWTLGSLNQKIDMQLYCHALDCVAASINISKWAELETIHYARLSRHGVRLACARFEPFDKLKSSKDLHKILLTAGMLSQQLQLSAAERMCKQALSDVEEVVGSSHSLFFDALHVQGHLYRQQGKVEEAEQSFVQALAGCERVLGPDHPSTMRAVLSLAITYLARWKLKEAEEMFSRALALREKTVGPSHPLTLAILRRLGDLYLDQDKNELAEQAFDRSLIKEAGLDEGHELALLDSMDKLGLRHLKAKRIEEARRIFVQVIAGKEKIFGAQHPSTLVTVHNYGILEYEIGNYDEAEKLCNRALLGYEKVYWEGHLSTVDTIYILGHVYYMQDKLEDAESMFKRAMAGYEQVNRDSIYLFESAFFLGCTYHEQGRNEDAEKMLEYGMIGCEKITGPQHPKTIAKIECVCAFYREQKQDEKADELRARFDAVLS